MFEKFFKKRRRHLVTDHHIKENNLIVSDKSKLLRGEIILTHCRGHDTILIFLFVCLKVFTSNTYVYSQEITVVDNNG